VNIHKFYKGVLESDLKTSYVPGTVTTVFNEALMWKERIESNKTKGAARNVRHGKSVIIEIVYESDIATHEEFQRSGVKEHNRVNCWTSSAKNKAQINSVCQYRILDDSEINQLYKP
jgi:hypothetical protein